MPEMTIGQALDLAVRHHRAGRLGQAEQMYRRILLTQPDHPDALHLLGVVAIQTGHAEAAADLIRRAVARQPGNADMLGNLGSALAKSGRFEEAVEVYRQALGINPGHADAHANLGSVLKDLGRVDEAVAAYRRAVEIRPGFAEAHYKLGNALREQGRWEEAMAAYREAVRIRPQYADAHARLGEGLLKIGRVDEAVAACRRAVALAADSAEAHTNLGVALREKGEADEAIAAHRRAIALKPGFAEAHSNLALALKDKGQWEEAVVAMEEAVRLSPGLPAFYCNLGATLLGAGRLDEAAAASRRAIELKPDMAQAHCNLGAVLREIGELEAAVAEHYRAIELDPALAEAHCQLGVALKDKGDVDEAAAALRRAVALTPAYARAWANLGATLHDAGNLDEATAAYRRALAIDPGHADAHCGLGMGLLARGEFVAGWDEYEWRWGASYATAGRRDYSQPRWDGGPFAGRTLLLYAEQGLGDTIQFARYLPVVARGGGNIVLECQPELLRLLQPLAEATGSRLVGRGQPLPPFDLHCPLLSVPRALGTTLENLPAQVPYLRPDSGEVEAWRERLGRPADRAEPSGGLAVGLVWAGSAKHRNDRHRSLPLARLAPLARVPNVRWVSLQTGPAAAQAQSPPAGMRLLDLTADLRDFADTAALLANLDLVIGVDTAVVHLAGAMARPVWTLLPYRPDWRWMLGREDSPWYPTMRLFRQPSFGDWDSVIERVAGALAEFQALGEGHDTNHCSYRPSCPARLVGGFDAPGGGRGIRTPG